MTCKCENWDEIHKFHSLIEYEQFIQWINDQINQGPLKEVSILHRYADATFDEHQYLCMSCNKRWRLVAPDAPFQGVFEVVKSKEL
jgi:hypothetical protein